MTDSIMKKSERRVTLRLERRGGAVTEANTKRYKTIGGYSKNTQS